jgi:hypothetical protein
MALQAYVLIQAEPQLAGRVASAVRDLPQVASCDVLAGPYDDAIALVESLETSKSSEGPWSRASSSSRGSLAPSPARWSSCSDPE